MAVVKATRLVLKESLLSFSVKEMKEVAAPDFNKEHLSHQKIWAEFYATRNLALIE